MCGIAAIFGLERISDARERMERMVRAMRHRGPDARGLREVSGGVLGHARLSILDTSSQGLQPMTRRGVTIVYNGECYNFQEHRRRLQDRGYVFESTSDTEVLLNMYLEYGRDFVAKLRGIFAFVLHDGRDGTVLCARDQIGVKPLYYAQRNGGLIVASELRTLLASGLVAADVDRKSLSQLLRNGSVPQPGSILRDVSMLMPGRTMTYDGKVLSFSTYWKMASNRLPLLRAPYATLLEAGRERVEEALRLQLVSDVPLGAFLSGGIDSSLLVALMQRVHGDVRTFSIGFESGLETISEDETSDAEEVARHLGTRHRSVIVSRREIIDALPRIARDLDHPTVDGVNSWFVSKVASEELTVAISGTGGDELFCGYPWFSAMLAQERPVPSFLRLFAQALRHHRDFAERYRRNYLIFTDEAASRLMPGEPLPPLIPDDPLPKTSTLSRVTGLTLSGYTRNQLLFDIDTASMAHGLEVRVPLLDTDLLDFALSLPDSAKLGGGDPSAQPGSYAHSGVKRLLMDIGRDMLPPGFAQRAKRGFTLPFDGWLRAELSELCHDLLSPATVRRRGFFDPEAVADELRRFENREAYWPNVWLLMMTEAWAEQVLDVSHGQ